MFKLKVKLFTLQQFLCFKFKHSIKERTHLIWRHLLIIVELFMLQANLEF